MSDVLKEALAGYGEGHDRKPIGENVPGALGVSAPSATQTGPYQVARPAGPSQATGPAKGNKSPTTSERLGAKYRIEVPRIYAQNSDEASATMQNAIIIKSVVNRSSPNFQSGQTDAYKGI